MKKRIFVLTFFLPLPFLLSCANNNPSRTRYQPIGLKECNSNIERRTVNIDEMEIIDKNNAHDYTIDGTCSRNESEITIRIEGHPLDKQPFCNQGKWRITVDLTGIINQKRRIQVAVSQAGSGGGLLCKNVENYFVCTDGYIGVPRIKDVTSESFCVMKYEAKVRSGTKLPTLVNRFVVKAEALVEGTPITGFTEDEAIKSCRENGAGYDLINNDQWQTIARHIELEAVNWSEGITKIENGNLLNIGNISGVKSSSNDDNINDNNWRLNKRSHKLINTEYIWDFSGNLAEIVQNNISSLPVEYTGYIYKLPAGLKELFGPERNYGILDDRERINGFARLGWMQGNRFEGSLIRGGNTKRTAGIFSVDTTISAQKTNRRNIGFRCVYNP